MLLKEDRSGEPKKQQRKFFLSTHVYTFCRYQNPHRTCEPTSDVMNTYQNIGTTLTNEIFRRIKITARSVYHLFLIQLSCSISSSSYLISQSQLISQGLTK